MFKYVSMYLNVFQFYSIYIDKPNPKLVDKRILLVLPFKNLANSSEHDFIAESMFDFFWNSIYRNEYSLFFVKTFKKIAIGTVYSRR